MEDKQNFEQESSARNLLNTAWAIVTKIIISLYLLSDEVHEPLITPCDGP